MIVVYFVMFIWCLVWSAIFIERMKKPEHKPAKMVYAFGAGALIPCAIVNAYRFVQTLDSLIKGT